MEGVGVSVRGVLRERMGRRKWFNPFTVVTSPENDRQLCEI